VITARHRTEDVQKVPVAVSVIGGDFIDKTNTSNIAQISQFVPSVQFTFFNARNANINVRGIGNNVGLANDGIEPGVGFYVDGVYYSRPATATFDLVDIDHVEVLRGPQGTLFGKNTTAGAINITTKGPSFTPEATAEASGANLGYFQFKGAVAGPIIANKLAGRLSIATTSRSGLLVNEEGGNRVNAYRNRSIRAQLLYQPTDNIKARLIGDFSKQDTNCCVLVLSGIVSPPNGKDFRALAQSFGYTPTVDPFSRQADVNSTVQARQETGGVSSQVDWTLPGMILTSVTAWRYWNWYPANDADNTPISVLTKAQNGDHERQFTQEFRLASSGSGPIEYVGGLYLFSEQIKAITTTTYGNAGAAFILGATRPSIIADGYTIDSGGTYHTTSLAAFGQAVWHVTSRLKLTGGLRYTYDHKRGLFSQVVSGGAPLTGTLAALAPLRAALGTSTAFNAGFDDGAVSGLADISYQITPDIMAYANYARGDKSGGLNLTQLPAGANSIIAPETLDAYEVGLKTHLFDGAVTLNGALFWQNDQNYQANLIDPVIGKQYLSNVPKVRSRGVEVDATARLGENLNLYSSLAYDDAIYDSFVNGVCGLERITSPRCDLSGADLAGVPRWSVSVGGEYHRPITDTVEAFGGFDYTFRSSLYSAATDSIYSKLPALSLVNARLGVRSARSAWSAYVWVKNLADEKYFTFTSAGTGNTGALFSQLGDPRAFGATFRVKY
jgi:iron complex outermembrane receptor protein